MREKPVEKPFGRRLSFNSVEKPFGRRLSFNSLFKLNKILIGIKRKMSVCFSLVLWARLNIGECHHGSTARSGFRVRSYNTDCGSQWPKLGCWYQLSLELCLSSIT